MRKMTADGCEGSTGPKALDAENVECKDDVKMSQPNVNDPDSGSCLKNDFKFDPNVTEFSPQEKDVGISANWHCSGDGDSEKYVAVAPSDESGKHALPAPLLKIDQSACQPEGFPSTDSAIGTGYPASYSTQIPYHAYGMYGYGPQFEVPGSRPIVQPPPQVRHGVVNGHRVDFLLAEPRTEGHYTHLESLAHVARFKKGVNPLVTYSRGATWHCWTLYHPPRRSKRVRRGAHV